MTLIGYSLRFIQRAEKITEMNLTLFVKSLIRCCFRTTREHQTDTNKAKYIASLERLEYCLDIEQELGFQRHFITVGNRIRHASKELSNAN